MSVHADDMFNGIILENNIVKGPELDFEPDRRGLGYYLMESMKHNRYKVSQYLTDSEEEDSYLELLQRSVRTALTLSSMGLGQSDVVCLCTSNHKNSCVPYIGAVLNGMIMACLDPSLPLTDTEYLLSLVNPKMVFVEEGAVQLIETALENIQVEAHVVVFGDTDTHIPFGNFLDPIDGEDDFEPVTPNDLTDTAAILFSSGTTGLPKGICISHYALIVNPYIMTQNGSIEKNSVVLCFSSLYWVSATLFMFAAIFAGRPRVISPSFDAGLMWTLIEKYKVTISFVGPSQCFAFYRHGRPENIDTSSFVYLLTGGGPLNLVLMENVRDILPGTWVAQGYGSTEMGSLISCFRPNVLRDTRLLHYKPGSCGTALPGCQYKIVDIETDELLGPNQQGELRLKSRSMTTGYYNMDSSSAFDEDGWLKTGDVVYYDDDLCFYVVDRIKEMLKFRSWQVAPAMLENIAMQHQAVKQAVVIGLPHPEDGDHAMALVVLQEGSPEVTEEEIERFVNEKVSDKQKLMAGVKFVEYIPVTPSGKIKRRDLKKMVLSGEI